MNAIKIQSEKSLSKDYKSNHEIMTKDSVAESLLRNFDLLFTAFSIFTVFKTQILILVIFKYLFKNNIRNLNWSSKFKTESKKMSFKVIVLCKMSVLHNYLMTNF